MINPVRGEVALVLDGNEYPMLPSYGAMVSIEQQLGSLVALSVRFGNGNATVRELALVAEAAIKAHSRESGEQSLLKDVSADRLAEKIYENGVIDCMRAIDQLLANMLSGGTKPKKNDADLP